MAIGDMVSTCVCLFQSIIMRSRLSPSIWTTSELDQTNHQGIGANEEGMSSACQHAIIMHLP